MKLGLKLFLVFGLNFFLSGFTFNDWPLPAPFGTTIGEGETIQGKFSNASGSRGYSLYVPPGLNQKAPLLVVLHGCFQTGKQMAEGTKFNSIADQRGFLVLYPEQS